MVSNSEILSEHGTHAGGGGAKESPAEPIRAVTESGSTDVSSEPNELVSPKSNPVQNKEQKIANEASQNINQPMSQTLKRDRSDDMRFYYPNHLGFGQNSYGSIDLNHPSGYSYSPTSMKPPCPTFEQYESHRSRHLQPLAASSAPTNSVSESTMIRNSSTPMQIYSVYHQEQFNDWISNYEFFLESMGIGYVIPKDRENGCITRLSQKELNYIEDTFHYHVTPLAYPKWFKEKVDKNPDIALGYKILRAVLHINSSTKIDKQERNNAEKNHNSCDYCKKTGHKTKNCPDIEKLIKFKDRATKAKPAPPKLNIKDKTSKSKTAKAVYHIKHDVSSRELAENPNLNIDDYVVIDTAVDITVINDEDLFHTFTSYVDDNEVIVNNNNAGNISLHSNDKQHSLKDNNSPNPFPTINANANSQTPTMDTNKAAPMSKDTAPAPSNNANNAALPSTVPRADHTIASTSKESSTTSPPSSKQTNVNTTSRTTSYSPKVTTTSTNDRNSHISNGSNAATNHTKKKYDNPKRPISYPKTDHTKSKSGSNRNTPSNGSKTSKVSTSKSINTDSTNLGGIGSRVGARNRAKRMQNEKNYTQPDHSKSNDQVSTPNVRSPKRLKLHQLMKALKNVTSNTTLPNLIRVLLVQHHPP